MDTLLTLYVEDENKKELQRICKEAGCSFEAGLNMMVQRILTQPELAKRLLYQAERIKRKAVSEITVEELIEGIQAGNLIKGSGDPVMVTGDLAEPCVFLSAKQYGAMSERLERLEEKLIIHKNSPC